MSEQQEWTPERLAQYANPDHSDLNQLSSAIKAALATERDEREIVERSRAAWKSQVAGLAEALAAERQRREQTERSFDAVETERQKCKSQLLSAQAAIEKAKKRTWAMAEKWSELESVDLSDLHQHDAEVRKPLVEVLEDCESALAAFLSHHPAGAKARAVLAEVEGK
ncbi:MAG: hypothetical protein DMF62_00530 [Acidobacteria bacterium]|nr:MAG: hypothetical protein DMF62_00530 [Acidobacteriota bacterium]